jgi:hypothetical protein
LAFITFGHHALIAGNRQAAIDGVILTIILAVIFTALQYFEYSEATFTISDGVYGSAFYASTGLHGLLTIVPIKLKIQRTMINNIIPRFEKSRLLSFSLTYNTSNSLALWSLKSNKLMFNNINFKSFIHSSSIIKSERSNTNNLNPSINSETISPDYSNILQVEVARQERDSQLQVEKYTQKPQEDESPWEESNNDMPTIDIPKELREEFGLILEHTHPISMFEGVKIISRYLELRHNIDPETIYEIKLTEILKIFEKSNGLVTAEDLFQHMNNKFEENKEFYIDKLQTETKNLSENLITEDSKPFGQYGEVTLNQIGLNLKENLKHLNDIRWDLVYENTKLSVHAAPAVISAISYSLLLKTYIRHIHNRPFDVGISSQKIAAQKIVRNRQLGLFCILGAPLTMLILRFSAIPIKDMFSLSIGGDSLVGNSNSNSDTINSILFLSSLNKKIPKWLKILFKFLFVTIIVLKLLGFSFLSVLSINVFYIKVAYYILFSLIICYHLLSLYLLHKFSKKNMKILEVWPEFLIKRLKEIEMMSTTKAEIKEFKTNCYMEISVYLILMTITIIVAILF